MKLEVLSKESNATTWIIAGLKRRVKNLDEATEETCEEVAKELGFKFERKQNGNYSFEDKIH
jgi:hypothetical protein